jgi:hypothetical protein
MVGPGLEHPKVLIAGDIRLSVTESEAALHAITGHYCIETAGMGEPLYMLWHAAGQTMILLIRMAEIKCPQLKAPCGDHKSEFAYLHQCTSVSHARENRVCQKFCGKTS